MTLMTRRTLAKGATWAVPVLTVVAAAPASAASPSDAQPLMAYYESENNSDPSPITNVPKTAEQPEFSLVSIIFAEPNGANDTVVSMKATIYLPVANLTFSLSNGGYDALESGQDQWNLPAGPSGTTVLNGTTCYAYDFTWSGSAAPVDSFDYDGAIYALFDFPELPNLRVQVTGGSLSPDMPVQSALTVVTASGGGATRTGPVETAGSFGANVGDPL